jgi:probable F420-dependent oxidoreductase
MAVIVYVPALARAIARRHLAPYLRLPNYTNNLRRLGFTTKDLADEGSDGLVDALVAWGDPRAVAGRVEEHLVAGADHVAVQLVDDREIESLVQQWTVLAPVLNGAAA